MSYIPPSLKLSTKAYVSSAVFLQSSMGVTITGFSSGDSNLVIFVEAAYTVHSGDAVGASLIVSPPFTSISTVFSGLLAAGGYTYPAFGTVYSALNTTPLSGVSITYLPSSSKFTGWSSGVFLHATAFTNIRGSTALFSQASFGFYQTSSYSQIDRSSLYQQIFNQGLTPTPLESGAIVIDSISTGVTDGGISLIYANAYKNYMEGFMELVGWTNGTVQNPTSFFAQYPTLLNHFSVAAEWNMQSSPTTTSFGYTFTSSDSWGLLNDVLTPNLTGLIRATLPTSPYPVVGSSLT